MMEQIASELEVVCSLLTKSPNFMQWEVQSKSKKNYHTESNTGEVDLLSVCD